MQGAKWLAFVLSVMLYTIQNLPEENAHGLPWMTDSPEEELDKTRSLMKSALGGGYVLLVKYPTPNGSTSESIYVLDSEGGRKGRYSIYNGTYPTS